MDPNLELVRGCLTLIGRIALRAANSPSAEHVVDALFELTYVLSKYPFSAQTLDPPVSDKEIRDLHKMHPALDFIDSTSQEFTAYDMMKYATTSTWN